MSCVLGSTNKKVTEHSFNPPYINFSNEHISGAKGLCSFKFLLLLLGDDSLVTLPHLQHTFLEMMPKDQPSDGNVIGGIASCIVLVSSLAVRCHKS